jgi:hypothetical protein
MEAVLKLVNSWAMVANLGTSLEGGTHSQFPKA